MKNVIKKWWFWLIVVVVIGGIGGAIGGASGSKNTSDADNTKGESSSLSESSVVSSLVEEIETEKRYGLGETAVAKSYKLTVNDLKTVESDNQFAQPDDGKEYVEVELILENTSGSELAISSVLNCNAYEDGFAISENLSVSVAAGTDSFNGTVASGKKLKGSLYYELNEGWTELEIDVDIGISNDDEIKILLTK